MSRKAEMLHVSVEQQHGSLQTIRVVDEEGHSRIAAVLFRGPRLGIWTLQRGTQQVRRPPAVAPHIGAFEALDKSDAAFTIAA